MYRPTRTKRVVKKRAEEGSGSQILTNKTETNKTENRRWNGNQLSER